MYRKTLFAFFASISLVAGGCATPRYDDGPSRYANRTVDRVEYGYVDRIDTYRSGDNAPVGAGAVIGGIAGGVLGHQIGSGRGNSAATIAGAIGGALVGNEVEKNHRVEGERHRITVRLDSGAIVTVEDDHEMDLRTGDRVRVENNRVARV